MATITSTGIGSGLDVNSIVTQLMALESRPLNLLQQSANTLNTRLKQLRAARLVEHGGDGYRLTHQGADLASRMTDVQLFAGRWAQQQARTATVSGNGAAAAHPASP